MRRPALPLRRRLLLSVMGALAVALVVLVGAFNLVLRERLNHEANSALGARAAAQLSTLHVVAGRVSIAETADAGAPDTQAWVFTASGKILEQPPSDPAVARAADQLAAAGTGTIDPPGTHTRLYAVPVLAGGRRVGTVVSAISMAPYASTAQTALISSIVLGLVLLGVVALAARRLISAALAPVADMTRQAAAWSQIDSGRRFGLGPPHDELTDLAATLDGLLDRVATSLRHEQRFSAELSHELRSPLASVIAEAQLALKQSRPDDESRAGYEHVLAAAQRMRRTLGTLLTAARVEHRPAAAAGDALAAARAAAEGCAGVADDRAIRVTVHEPGAPIRVGVETQVAERVLAPLIENACRYGASAVEVSLSQLGGAVHFTVQDDGPGVPAELREQVFEPGWRNGLSSEHGEGAGLGLPLARRLARAAGGDVYAEAGGPGGRFAVRLPTG